MNAYFIKSASKLAELPPPLYPEVCFAGRSNVGKSSLMNALLERKNLVKTGKTPGKTRLLNFFAVEDKLLFTDLPGYGYAEVSKKERENWAHLVHGYLKNRKNLVLCLLLIDIRRSVGEEELFLLSELNRLDIGALPVLTKADKFSKSAVVREKERFARELRVTRDELIHFSVPKKEGREAVLKAVELYTGIAL